MKTSKLLAFLLAAAVIAPAAAGCDDKNNNAADNQPATSFNTNEELEPMTPPTEHGPVGENEMAAELGKEISANDTDFTLNSVIDGGTSDDGKKFLYLDITLRNDTDNAYTLSTLNNFYIITPGNEELYSDVRAQLYAQKKFNEEKFFTDPFDIPSNGQFSGIIGGYTVDAELTDFTLCFFPTGKDPLAKETVFKYNITAADIKPADPAILK